MEFEEERKEDAEDVEFVLESGIFLLLPLLLLGFTDADGGVACKGVMFAADGGAKGVDDADAAAEGDRAAEILVAIAVLLPLLL